MSTINSPSGISYIYTPSTSTTSYTDSLWQDPASDKTTNSDTDNAAGTSSDSITVSSQLEQLSQGILTDDTIENTSAPKITSYADILKKSPSLSSSMINLNTQQTLLNSMNSGSGDLLAGLSSEFSLVDNSIGISNASSVESLLTGGVSSDIAALGEELNELNSGATSASTASSSTSPLSYSYSPSAGITTNSDDDSIGSNIDLSL